jgi:putative sigma-54 modulation protein
MTAIKRQPKEEKLQAELLSVRPRRASRTRNEEAEPARPEASPKMNGKHSSRTMVPVTVHTFPATRPIEEPHVVRSSDSVALRPMTIEEAVKEAEFRDRDVFVFRNNEGTVCVLHRKRDGKMELIEAP